MLDDEVKKVETLGKDIVDGYEAVVISENLKKEFLGPGQESVPMIFGLLQSPPGLIIVHFDQLVLIFDWKSPVLVKSSRFPPLLGENQSIVQVEQGQYCYVNNICFVAVLKVF